MSQKSEERKALTIKIGSEIYDRMASYSKKTRLPKVVIAELALNMFFDNFEQKDVGSVLKLYSQGENNIQEDKTQEAQSQNEKQVGDEKVEPDEKTSGKGGQKQSILSDEKRKVTL